MAQENTRLTSRGTNTTNHATQATQTAQTSHPTPTTATTSCHTTCRGNVLEHIAEWWDNLADPSKIRRESTTDVLRSTRDNMLLCLIMGTLLFIVRKSLPTLFVGLGFVELFVFFMENYDMRDAIAHDESYREAQRRTQRAGGRLIRNYLVLVVVLTALACWINSGAQWASDFPLLQTFAVKQTELVNETFDWFKWFVSKF